MDRKKSRFFRVWIGACRLEEIDHLPSLVVEADFERLEELRKLASLNNSYSDIIFKQAILGSNDQREVKWYRYNDSRLDGVISLERWRSIYPNVEMIDCKDHKIQTLADILDEWSAYSLDAGPISITISQGNPLRILEGLASKIDQLFQVEISGIRAAEIWENEFENWLISHDFRVDPSNPQCWNRDLNRTEAINYSYPDSLRIQHEGDLKSMHERVDKLFAILDRIFPYDYYRKANTDLANLSDHDLIESFIRQDENQQSQSLYHSLDAELMRQRVENKEYSKLIEILNEKNSQIAHQLDLLKDLVARILVRS